MSTELISCETVEGVSLTRFYGGPRGVCYQLNANGVYIVLSSPQLRDLIVELCSLIKTGTLDFPKTV